VSLTEALGWLALLATLAFLVVLVLTGIVCGAAAGWDLWSNRPAVEAARRRRKAARDWRRYNRHRRW
jgi:hypothetical protein